MNYIKLINKFWEIRREREDFDPYVISLYFALTNAANSNNWDEFSAYREDIVAMAGMSPSAYYKSRKILQDAGLIGFKEGANKLSKCMFTVFPLYATNTVSDTLQRHSKDSNLHTTKTENDTILNKQVNTKTNKVNKPKNKKTKAVAPEVDLFKGLPEEFSETWEKFQAIYQERYPTVAKLELQLTPKELYQLTINYSKSEIADTLAAMENYKKVSNYRSVYLTLNKWIQRELAKAA